MHTLMRAVCVAVVGLVCCVESAAAATVELSWKANTEPDLAGYKVYHFAGSTCPAVLPPLMIGGAHVTLPKGATKYTHTASDVHGLWCYEITAFDMDMNESLRSNRASKVFDSKAPAAPVLQLGSPTP